MSDISERMASLSPAKRRLLQQMMEKKPRAAEPIAIVGMACRLPGARNLDEYWDLISQQRVATSEVPPSRWDVDELYDPTGEVPGKTSTRWGAFVDDIDKFDSLFFGISPREAEKICPQQRMLLEVAWESLENAGVNPDSLRGQSTGVYVGIGSVDYSRLPAQYDDYFEHISVHGGTGNALSVAANRISYIFDLKGPSMAIDTACSSGLVAIHLAAQSLRSGECDSALAGAVNAILSPETTIAFSKARMLSPDGVCRPFDAGANGYVRGEGCGLFVLKRLTDAEAAGDNVLAVIRGTAINQDGRTSGITAPNAKSQQAVINAALAEAGLSTDDISYIEAHGTGTPLGDPIELESLTALFRRKSADAADCLFGSVKANIGHTETVAGIAGLMKVILMMRHGLAPGQASFEQLNPRIRLDGTRLKLVEKNTPWESQRRIAGVSSFGFGGANAHLVVEEAGETVTAPSLSTTIPSNESSFIDGPGTDRPRHVLTLSAKTPDALREQTAQYLELVKSLPTSSVENDSIADLCNSAAVGRAHLPHRLALTAANRAELQEKLAAASEETSRADSAGLAAATRPRAAFLFSGQGSQYIGMGRELFRVAGPFRDALTQCDEILHEVLDEPLLSVLFDERDGQSQLDETVYTQPALFSLEYALARQWQAWGIEPDVVAGHSVGEYAAACIAGVFSLEDGLRLIAHRARLMQQLPREGGMLVVFAPASEVEQRLEPFRDAVSIAAINSPTNTVLSGRSEQLEELNKQFTAEGIRTQPLVVSHAFHSPLMDSILEEFEEFANGLEYRAPQIPIASNLTGEIIEDAQFDARYWTEHIRGTVRFADGVGLLTKWLPDVLLEIGPATTLISLARQCWPEFSGLSIPSLRRGQKDWDIALQSVSQLYTQGAKIDWQGFDKPWPRRRESLPTYPFQRTRLWYDFSKSHRLHGGVRARALGPAEHPLLGSRLPMACSGRVYENEIATDRPKYLRDHVVQGSVVVPAAAYLEQALAAADSLFGAGAHGVDNLSVQQALILPEGESRQLQLSASEPLSGQSTLEIHSRAANDKTASTDAADQQQVEEAPWQLHATSTAKHADTLNSAANQPEAVDLPSLLEQPYKENTREYFYGELAKRELNYGPAFQVIGELRQYGFCSLAKVQLADEVVQDQAKYHFHPALWDGGLQTCSDVIPHGPSGASMYTYVPTHFEKVRVYRPGEVPAWIHAERTSADDSPEPETVEARVRWLTDDGNVIAEVIGARLQRLGRAGADEELANQRYYEINWEAKLLDTNDDAASETIQQPASWLLLADSQGLAAALADKLTTAGEQVTLVTPADKFSIVEDSAPRRRLTVDPLAETDWRQAIETAQVAGLPLQVVHCWSFDLDAANQIGLNQANSGDIVAKSRTLGPVGAAQLIKQLARASGANSYSLTLATQGAVDTGDNNSTQGSPFASALWGLGRVVAMEQADLQTRLIDLSGSEQDAEQLLAELRSSDGENQIAYRAGTRLVGRLAVADDIASENENGVAPPAHGAYALRLGKPGTFDSLKYVPLQREVPTEGQVEMEVRAAALNFSDVLKAMGLYPGLTDKIVPLGIECSGVVTAIGEGVDRFNVGDEVMGVAPHSFASHARTADYALVKKPAGLSHQEAATVPITFLTAYYGLRRLADLQAGERLLIHAGAGGVGLAAIQIAQDVGAEIFATAGSDEKRDYLRSLGVQHIFDSRTLDFADEILSLTSHEGVDVVLNSLPGEAITKSISILKAYGRFLEIGKIDIYQNRMIGLLPFQDNLSYFAIDLDRMLRQRSDYIRKLFAEVMEYFDRGVYRALPIKEFAAEEVTESFRYMAMRKNIGKIVVSFDRDQQENVEQEGASDATNKSLARKDGAYLITGGLGALGLQVAHWLAEQGPGHLALLSRRAPNEATAAKLAELRSRGVEVQVVQADVTDRESLAAGLNQLRKTAPPLRGVFHAAGVLADGMLFDMPLEQFERAVTPKVNGAWNLHELTSDDPLDHFVLFSSVAAVLGSPGQGNYAAGNAFLDGLASCRRRQGLPAVAINWGPWAGSGMAVADDARERNLSTGVNLLPPDEALSAMGMVMRGERGNVAIVDADWNELAARMPQVPPLLANLVSDSGKKSGGDSQVDNELRKELLAADAGARVERLRLFIRSEVAQVMNIPDASLDADQPLSALGLDSLMGMEIKSKLEAKLGLKLPMAALFDNPSVGSLAIVAAKALGAADEGGGDASAQTAASWTPLVPLSQNLEATSVFCIHPLGGDVRCYFSLAKQLTETYQLWAVRPRGISEGQPAETMREMAEEYVAAIRQSQPEGPYYLLGWSSGGVFALEVAQVLREQQVELAPLVLVDSPYPEIFQHVDIDDDARFLFDTVNFSNWFAEAKMEVDYDQLHSLGGEAALQLVLDQAHKHGVLSADATLEHLRRLIDICKSHTRMLAAYEPPQLNMTIHLIRPEDKSTLIEASGRQLTMDLGWGAVLKDQLVLHPGPGNHFSMMTADHGEALAQIVRDCWQSSEIPSA